MKKTLKNLSAKASNKVVEMKRSDKKGMAAIGWILTIVFTLAVVGIIWIAVQPSVQNTATTAGDQINSTTTSILDEAKLPGQE